MNAKSKKTQQTVFCHFNKSNFAQYYVSQNFKVCLISHPSQPRAAYCVVHNVVLVSTMFALRLVPRGHTWARGGRGTGGGGRCP